MSYVYGARLRFWAILACVVVAVCAARRSDAQTLEPFLGYTHVSDVLTGRPFLTNPAGCEPTTDWLGAGVTVVWPRVEIDFAHGIKARDMWCSRSSPTRGHSESGTLVTMRWYPWRNRPSSAPPMARKQFTQSATRRE